MRLKFNRLSKGFGLFEVLTAIMVFVVGIVSIIWAFGIGIAGDKDNENVEIALSIAQAKLEEIRDMGFVSIGDISETEDPNFDNFFTAVNVDEQPAGLKRVDVIVSWLVKGGEADVTLSTLIVNTNNP